MFALIRLLTGSLIVLFRSRASLAAEIMALRHQLGVYHRTAPARPHLTRWDRVLWAFILYRWSGWRRSLIVVQPETVIKWHRRAFRLFRQWKSRGGRPSIRSEIRGLIREMARSNPTWGAPRIHAELLKLGFEVSKRTVSRYLARIRPKPARPGSQTWASFLRNQAKGIVACLLSSALATTRIGAICHWPRMPQNTDQSSRPSWGRWWPFPGWAGCITATPAAPPEWRARRTRIVRPAKVSGLSSDPLRGVDACLQSRDRQRALGHGLSRISAFVQHPVYGEPPSVSRLWRTTGA